MNICRSYSEQFDSSFVWRLLFILCSIALITTASDAFATTADPVGDVLCKLILLFRGNTARGIAIIAIIVLGIQTLRGQLKWEVALVIVTGIVILFKAPEIINMVAGSGAASQACTGT
ncbi:TrbC/VirB2 family protein [Candidatus Tisiphia endosymbiont of Ptychoptera albimana]|uniref:TrbC/VirB2 family protein n=1 Tax=Candidatus Tisiphia endosymbiont of Ptychoptera albimana TaxID=3066260 RepID=UPI00312C7B3C